MSLLESGPVRDLLERAGLAGLRPATVRAAAVLVFAVVALGVWRFWPAAPEPEIPLQDAGGTESVGAAPEAADEIVVHVAGAVMRPGVYRLPVGSRVDDAIAAAGGGIATAALDGLNRARILADGEQVYVPTLEEMAGVPGQGPEAAGGGSASGDGTVNINTASADELEQLPGVGPSTAQKIVEDRETNGPFATPEDLMRVTGIGEKKFEAMREFVVCR